MERTTRNRIIMIIDCALIPIGVSIMLDGTRNYLGYASDWLKIHTGIFIMLMGVLNAIAILIADAEFEEQENEFRLDKAKECIGGGYYKLISVCPKERKLVFETVKLIADGKGRVLHATYDKAPKLEPDEACEIDIYRSEERLWAEIKDDRGEVSVLKLLDWSVQNRK